jgi:transposase
MVAADDRTALIFSLSPGQASDGVEGRALLEEWDEKPEALPDKLPLAMDKAYEGDETRACVQEAGFTPVVPPKENRKEPWEYDKELYKRRNEVERLFRKLKGFRRIFTRFEKLDVMFKAFLLLALAFLVL